MNSLRLLIITPFWEAGELVYSCLTSLCRQDFQDFHCVVIDDGSIETPPGPAALQEFRADSRFTFVTRESRVGALKNYVDATELMSARLSDSSVITAIHGDDTLVTTSSLSEFMAPFDDPDCWFAYSRLRRVSNGQEIPEHPYGYGGEREWKSLDSGAFRSVGWRSQPLRGWRFGLWKLLDQARLKNSRGEYFDTGSDKATVFPMMEMSGMNRIRFVPQATLLYNDKTGKNDYVLRREQNRRESHEISQFPRHHFVPTIYANGNIAECLHHKITDTMPDVLFVSYCTDEYTSLADELVESINAQGLSYHIEKWPSAGSWKANNVQRFVFLIDMFKRFPNRSVVWIDCDAQVVQLPSLFGEYHRLQVDMAAHMFDRAKGRRPSGAYVVDRGNSYYCYRTHEVLHGTVFYGAHGLRQAFMEDVLAWFSRHPTLHARSQPYVQDTLLRWQGELRRWNFLPMPMSYVQIDEEPRLDGEAVILHGLAHRKHKATIDKDSAPFWKCPGWTRGTEITKSRIRELIG